jgi:hypothetical protein
MKRGAAAVLGLALALIAGTACARDGHRGPRHGRWDGRAVRHGRRYSRVMRRNGWYGPRVWRAPGWCVSPVPPPPVVCAPAAYPWYRPVPAWSAWAW